MSGGLMFLGWVRTGLSAGISGSGAMAPLDAVMPARASLSVGISLGKSGSTGVTAHLIGPGDVTGFNLKQIIRMEPPDGAVGVAPNHFPHIEFDQPELPWMVSPATPQKNDPSRRGLRPWLCLIAIPDLEADIIPAGPNKPLPSVKVRLEQLPDLTTCWLWAHAQVIVGSSEDAKTILPQLLRQPSDRTLSRLIAPRRMRSNTRYLTCVVPTFENGRLAGLGLDAKLAEMTESAHAWDKANPDRNAERDTSGEALVHLPIYASWRFTTGDVGDFKYLAELLKPFNGSGIGVRPLDITAEVKKLCPDYHPSSACSINYEGLIADVKEFGIWPPDLMLLKKDFQNRLAERLDGIEGQLTPPIYGGQQSCFTGGFATGGGKQWLRELNLDPRYRVVAALGTRLIQQNQEDLMAEAWRQAANVTANNAVLRHGQMALELGEVLFQKRLGTFDKPVMGHDRFMQLTALVHPQIKDSRDSYYGGESVGTVAGKLSASPAAVAALSTSFRRLARPTGPLARKCLRRNEPLPAPVRPLVNKTMSVVPALPPVDLQFKTINQQVMSLKKRTMLRSAKGPGLFPDMLIGGMIGKCINLNGEPQLGWENSPASKPGFICESNYLGQLEVVTAFASRGIDDHPCVYGINSYEVTSCISFKLFPGTIESADFSKGGKGDGRCEKHSFRSDLEPYPPQPPPIPEKSIPVAVADLAGNGRRDIIMYDGGIVIALDVGPDGKAKGGWSGWNFYSDPSGGARSIAASQKAVYVLSGSSLTISLFDSMGQKTGWSRSIDWDMAVEPGFVCGAIALLGTDPAATVDLLTVQNIKKGDEKEVIIRVAHNVSPQGQITSWGPRISVPADIASSVWGATSVVVGSISKDSDSKRKAAIEAFTDAAKTTSRRLRAIISLADHETTLASAHGEKEFEKISDTVRKALVPTTTNVLESINTQLAIGGVKKRIKSLQPLVVTPKFTQPTYELLRGFCQEMMFFGASKIPDNSAMVLPVNTRFIEAFLAGLNHEMGRELLWRDYPVDMAGTYFSRFWDYLDDRDDILPLQSWENGLGSNVTGSSDQLLLVIRGDLLRRIPDAVIFAAPAKADSDGKRTMDQDPNKFKYPIFSGRLIPDLVFMGFNMNLSDACGTGDTDGYYFVFQEHPTAPRFGLNEPKNYKTDELKNAHYKTAPEYWDELDWSNVVNDENAFRAITNLDAGILAGTQILDSSAAGSKTHRWGFSSPHMAHILLRPPVMIARHASKLLL